VALLVFPTSPFNGQIYPPNPLPGQSVYQWDGVEQTWRLLGAASGVTSGTYGNSISVGQFTVDAAGRITAAQNVPIQRSSKTQLGVVQIGNNIDVDAVTGIISIPVATAGLPGVVIVGSNLSVTAGGILSVPNATVSNRGAVQLVNNTITNDATKALTAAAGFSLQNQINALVVSNNLTFAGTLSANGGLVTSVTPEGAAVGFVIGQPLPVPTLARDEYFVVVTTPGTFTPTGGSTPISAVDGDWFVAIDGVWTYFNIGPDIPRATFVQLDDIAGDFDGAQTIFSLTIGGAPYTPGTNANVLVSLGGVLQIPGDSFNIVGDSIDFSPNPPAADTSFLGYALTGVGGGGGIAGTGTVTQVNSGLGLTGGPITTSGILSLVPASTTLIGGVKPDNTTINVGAGGVISVNPAGLSFLPLTGGTLAGNLFITGANVSAVGGVFSGVVRTSNGTAAAPSYTFSTDTDTGLFYTAPNTLGLSAGGTAGITISALAVTLNRTLSTDNAVEVDAPVSIFSPSGTLRFYDADNSNYVGFVPPASVATDVSWTLPDADGSSGEVLATDGTGALQWITTAKIVAVPASSASDGAAGQIAFGGGFFYWYNTATSQWRRVSGSTF